MFAETAPAEIVQDWRNPVHYPVRITGFQFGETKFDTSNLYRFGSWTARFSGKPLIAKYPDARFQIMMTDLCCVNGSDI